MKQKNQTLFIEDRLGSSMSRWKPIARPWPGKGPVCPRIETEPQFCSRAGVWGANPPCEPGAHGLNRAFHSPALGAVAIPSWPANHGLCSTREAGVSWRAFPVTNPFLSAIFAPAGRPNSLRASSPSPILAAFGRKTVFTHTQKSSPKCHFSVLAFVRKGSKDGAPDVKMSKRLWLVGIRAMGNPSWIQPPEPCVYHMRLSYAPPQFLPNHSIPVKNQCS